MTMEHRGLDAAKLDPSDSAGAAVAFPISLDEASLPICHHALCPMYTVRALTQPYLPLASLRDRSLNQELSLTLWVDP